MDVILDFLKDQFDMISDNSNQFSASDQDLKKVNQLFYQQLVESYSNKQFKIRPRIEKYQIWSVRSEYENFLGATQKASHPFIVLIISDPDEIAEERFVRVNVISPYIEFAAHDDLVCNDSSLIGFPFLVETWNDQPVLSEILDEYLGYFEIELDSRFGKIEPSFEIESEEAISGKSDIIRLNRFQREFREIEISRAMYLNSSILSLISFLEHRQSSDSGAIITLSNKSEFPKFYIGHNQKEPDYALVAKVGVDTEDKYLYYQTNDLPFEIFIRKNEDGFILTITPFSDVVLMSSEKKEIEGISNLEKTVFSNLKKGLYTLKSEQIHEPIKLRFK